MRTLIQFPDGIDATHFREIAEAEHFTAFDRIKHEGIIVNDADLEAAQQFMDDLSEDVR